MLAQRVGASPRLTVIVLPQSQYCTKKSGIQTDHYPSPKIAPLLDLDQLNFEDQGFLGSDGTASTGAAVG